MVMSAKTGIVQLKISRNQGGGDISGTCPPPFGRPKNLPWTGNALKTGKMTRNQKKKGLFGEARFLTTSHLVVLVSGFGDYIINVWS